MLDLSHRPNVLYLASIERMNAAQRMIGESPRDYVLAAYLSGLAVETILQAVALRSGAAHDARHSLPAWLAKCSPGLHRTLRSLPEWTLLVALWDNKIRYLSRAGLIGYYRQK